jgi:hypothetical protein
MAAESAGSDSNSRRTRRYAAIVLAVFAALAVSLAVNTAWMHQRIFDTETFVETLAPLPRDPAISNAIAMHAVNALATGETLEGRIAEALPDQLGFLTPKFTGFVGEFVFDTTKRVVESEAFARIWTSSLRRSHTVIIGILDGDIATTDTGNIGIELDDASDLVLDRLEASGVDLFTDVETSFDEIILVQAEALAAPRSIVSLFHTSVWFFPVIALLLVAGAVFIDTDRLRPVEIFGFVTTGVILASLAAMRIVANIGFGSVVDPIDRAAVEAIWDTLLNGYVLMSAIVGVIALAIGIAALWWRFSRSVGQR